MIRSEEEEDRARSRDHELVMSSQGPLGSSSLPARVRAGGGTMLAEEIRFLFAYDRSATLRVLSVLDDLDPLLWTRTDVVGERGLGGILVHHLGASQRWRIGFETQGTDEGPEPESEPLPTIDELRERWEAEWATVDAWLPTLTDGFLAYVYGGVPVWQMLVHVVNHGTQHRAEAAALLTGEGRSPGELDLVDYAEERAQGGSMEARTADRAPQPASPTSTFSPDRPADLLASTVRLSAGIATGSRRRARGSRAQSPSAK
jgi:uncharacterized damage-inducible protein DinB